ncbi:hypothetical protein MBLNU457_4930t1 [Dothideomycetes sp. NU457]
MKTFAVIAAAAGLAAAQTTSTTYTATQGATYSFTSIAPKVTDPAGCYPNYQGQFEISVVNVSAVSNQKRQSGRPLTVTLKDGLLMDDAGRIGYIAANHQFQFDFGGQAGEIYTTGWSACSNGTLALGNSAIFYQCLSGGFYNLYDASLGAQCNPVYIDILGGALPSAASAASSTASASRPVSQISDGQIQASTSAARPVTQISDGQIQASTAAASSGRIVSQISDGQIQATTSAATSGRIVSQISDGQIQATTSPATGAATTGRIVSQISDGQIQATTSPASGAATTGRVVTQISDGQIQATTNGTRPSAATATVQAYTGAAAMPTAQLMAVAAGALAMLAL